MILKEYLARKSLSQKEFAEMIDVSRPYLTLIIQGKRRCSPELALKIEELTQQKVSRDEVMFPEFYPGWKLE